MKPSRLLRSCVSLFLLTITALCQSPSIAKPPDTPKRPVTDEYQGVKVVDEYRWLPVRPATGICNTAVELFSP